MIIYINHLIMSDHSKYPPVRKFKKKTGFLWELLQFGGFSSRSTPISVNRLRTATGPWGQLQKISNTNSCLHHLIWLTVLYLPSGKRLQFAIEHGHLVKVDLPIYIGDFP